MKAYYIHWNYPDYADDYLYYSGVDDDKLFYHRENAEKYANRELESIKELENKISEIQLKSEFEELTDEECDLLAKGYQDFPTSYNIREREIKFEDEL